ncbi:hypothetical protein [Aliifodinibius sp. S!AR15-10]|uniref:hypothetical protein n=1 Tax=Aliifodinibius sp. S!AR15-10 TaxID=2950437 RepID=UPI0028708500|nr:hypothetical protein [Aliifodinibius sp. S!AR15-10]
MDNNRYSVQIGSLSFSGKSIGYIISGFFLLGLLAGLLSIIHVDNPATPFWVTLPLFFANIIPVVFVVKGIRKAKEVS